MNSRQPEKDPLTKVDLSAGPQASFKLGNCFKLSGKLRKALPYDSSLASLL